MRISDWSSDVCSSDLTAEAVVCLAPLGDRHLGVAALGGLGPEHGDDVLERFAAHGALLGAVGWGRCDQRSLPWVPTRRSRNGTSLSARGSRGRPRTRSTLMLRWIWSVPPPMEMR